MTAFRRGFKTWCENAASGFRRDLSLAQVSPLDPRVLARHLNIKVWTPHEVARLGNLAERHVQQLLNHDSRSWSAVTLMLPDRRLIITNSTHAPVRQNSDIMHELAHLALDHVPARVDMTSKKLLILDTYNTAQEDEANWLSGALLVPRDALLAVLARNSDSEQAALYFNVRNQMLTWRRQATGVNVQLSRRSPSPGA